MRPTVYGPNKKPQLMIFPPDHPDYPNQAKSMKEILSERTLEEQGSFSRVERYLKGHHPEEGQLTFGYQGPETIQRIDVIKPIVIVTVVEVDHE